MQFPNDRNDEVEDQVYTSLQDKMHVPGFLRHLERIWEDAIVCEALNELMDARLGVTVTRGEITDLLEETVTDDVKRHEALIDAALASVNDQDTPWSDSDECFEYVTGLKQRVFTFPNFTLFNGPDSTKAGDTVLVRDWATGDERILSRHRFPLHIVKLHDSYVVSKRDARGALYGSFTGTNLLETCYRALGIRGNAKARLKALMRTMAFDTHIAPGS